MAIRLGEVPNVTREEQEIGLSACVRPINCKQNESEALLELVEDAIRDSADAQELVDDILDDVQERFALVQNGEFEREAGWPKRWQFESDDRLLFIKAVNQFSSNYAPRFGRLLTPLVSGIRVMGPFRPNWAPDSDVPALVLLDTEGIGHTPESAMSIPTAVTKKYDMVDAILLVDNATQPLQAGAEGQSYEVSLAGATSRSSQQCSRTSSTSLATTFRIQWPRRRMCLHPSTAHLARLRISWVS